MSWNWKNIFKNWTGVPVFILIVLFVIGWLVPYVTGKYQVWQVNNAYEKLAEPYYKNTYGGKTPEETYEMFITALKNSDVELASKYFVVEKQEQWKKTLNEFQKTNSLGSYLEEVEQNRINWILEDEKDENNQKTIFTYKYSRTKLEVTELPISGAKTQKLILPTGTFNGQVIFNKYPGDIWKIDLI